MPGQASLAFRRIASSYTSVLRSGSYRPLWLSQLVSNFGDSLHYIAIVVLVFEMTGQGLSVAGLVAAEIVPVLALGPIAGVIIDRFSRKSVLIGADVFRAVLVLSLVRPQGLWHVYVVAACVAAGNTFFNPTVQAVIPALTSADQRLAANSVSWSTGRLVQILASAVAAGLIGLLGTVVVFGINAFTFAMSAILIAGLAIPPHAGQIDSRAKRGLGAYLADLRAGLAFARHDRFISRLLLVQALASLATGATSALLIVLAERHLQLPPVGFAWLIGAIGVGALLGPLFPGALAGDYRDARWLFVPYVVRGVGDVLLATLTPVPIAVLILFVYGLNASAGIVVLRSVLQDTVPEVMRGRIFTLLDITWNAMRLLSLALGGVLVDLLGIRWVFWCGGILLIVAGILGLALLGRGTLPRQQTSSG